jgi:hypothetical protein
MNNFLASRIESAPGDIHEGLNAGVGKGAFVETVGGRGGYWSVIICDAKKRHAASVAVKPKEGSVLFFAEGKSSEYEAFRAIAGILRASTRVLYVDQESRAVENSGGFTHSLEFRTKIENEQVSRALQLFVGHYRTRILKESSGMLPLLVDMCNDVPDELAVHGLVYVLQTLDKSGTSYEFRQIDGAPSQPYSSGLEHDLLNLLKRREVFDTGCDGYLSPTALPAELKFEGDVAYLARVLFAGKLFGAKNGKELVPLTDKIAGYISMAPKTKEVQKYVKQLAEHWK